MSNSFCRFLSNGATFFATKDPKTILYSPCCWYKDSKIIKFLNKEEILNAQKEFNSIRDWTPACDQCESLEKSGQKSLRLSSFDLISENSLLGDIESLDVNLDKTCNAACVICSPSFSTLWAKEHNKHLNSEISISPVTNYIDQQIENIFESANFNLKSIRFFGGEPLFTETHVKLLRKIQNTENITLHYTTNGSIFPSDEVISLWKKFKLVLFCVSVDGIDNQFEYIRWPLKWNKVVANLMQLKNLAIPNIMFRFEYTLNFMNAFYFKEFEDWVKAEFEYNKMGDLTEINVHRYIGQEWDLSNIKQELADMIINKYGENHFISQFISQFEYSNNLEPWQKFVSKWEPIRGNSWKTAFPDLIKFYE